MSKMDTLREALGALDEARCELTVIRHKKSNYMAPEIMVDAQQAVEDATKKVISAARAVCESDAEGELASARAVLRAWPLILELRNEARVAARWCVKNGLTPMFTRDSKEWDGWMRIAYPDGTWFEASVYGGVWFYNGRVTENSTYQWDEGFKRFNESKAVFNAARGTGEGK